MKPRVTIKSKIRVIVCCRDADLRSELIKYADFDSVSVKVSWRKSVRDLAGSPLHAEVLCAVVTEDDEESALRGLERSKNAEVIVLCPHDRVAGWKQDVTNGTIHSYVPISPIHDIFDLTIRIRRVIERTSLRIELDQCHEQLQKLEEKKPESAAPVPEKGRVLVIEDDISAAELLTDILEPEGYSVKRATSVVNAYRDFPGVSFQVILVDLMMPGISGPKVVEVVRSKFASESTPIIVTSAHSEPHLIKECIEMGAVDFLVKPITRAKLLHRLSAALDN